MTTKMTNKYPARYGAENIGDPVFPFSHRAKLDKADYEDGRCTIDFYLSFPPCRNLNIFKRDRG